MADTTRTPGGDSIGGETRDIVYVRQEAVGRWARERSAFARWSGLEDRHLAAGAGSEDREKALALVEVERERRVSALRLLERNAREEKQQQRLPWPGQEYQLLGPVQVPFRRDPPTFFCEAEVAPTKTLVYEGAPAAQSGLVYPCPDRRRWSAWFGNDEVTLNQGYRYWYPSSARHPIFKNAVFTGRSTVDTRCVIQGLVDNGAHGSVTVDVATYLTIVNCTAADKNHDNGWHCDPRYDTIVGQWRSYCNGGIERFFSDTTPGLHTFAHYIDQPVTLNVCNVSGPDYFAETTHIVTITAVNADCQFGPNVADCSGASSYGWIETWWPKMTLEYVGLVPWT